MDSKDITDKFKNLRVQEHQDINILLLGESGVGKSTFINAIANYLHFKSFKKAEKQDLLVLIPASFHVFDEKYEEKLISIGSSNNNEYQEVGAAATQDVKTYVFPIGEGNTRLRLIDSPGVGDPRGVKQDDINCENILAYLGQLKELHAICFLMKPTNSRITVLFEYCFKEILSRLEKSASNNLIFIFTNTRGTDYGPGDTLPCLKKLIEDIKHRPPYVDIPAKNNIFCFDNESFRFLAAIKQKVKFSESVRQSFIDSWNKGSEECWRLIAYIIGDISNNGLRPHQMQNTVSINEARRLISCLSQPLADISQLIINNLHVLTRHKASLKIQNQSLQELQKNLYIPVINLEVIELTQSITVCASSKCAEIYSIGAVKKWHYRQRCHDPCSLGNITKDLIGDPGLLRCAAFSGSRTCSKCSCDFSVHMHVYYMTKTIDDYIVDDTINKNISDKRNALLEVERLIEDIDAKSKELEEESDIIIKSAAQFAHFLQNNAITPFNDSYKDYIEHLILREHSLGCAADQVTIKGLDYMLKQYEETKSVFETSLKGWFKQLGSLSKRDVVDASLVMSTIHDLYNLKHNGKKIKELLETQRASREKEYEKNCVEYVHSKVAATPSSDNRGEFKNTNSEAKGNKTSSKSNTASDYKKKYYVPNANQNTGNQNRPFSKPGTFQQNNSAQHYRRETAPSSYFSVPSSANQRGSDEQPKHERSKNHKVLVKVEVNKDNRQKGNRRDHSSQRRYPEYETQAPNYAHLGNYYEGPPQSYGPPSPFQYYDPGRYYGSHPRQYDHLLYQKSPGPYYGPPSGSYQGASGPYYGPPSGPHHPPGPYVNPSPDPSYHGPPFNPYYGPPSNGPQLGFKLLGSHGPLTGKYNVHQSRSLDNTSMTN